MNVEACKEVYGEGGYMLLLEATGILMQEAKPGGTMLFHYHNAFNELSHLEMLWTVSRHRLVGARFSFHCYKHWAQLLFRRPGCPLVILIIQEGVT